MTEHIRAEQLALYACGDLPWQDTSAVAAHVASCASCQEALAEFRGMQSFVTTSLQNPRSSELFEVRSRLTAKLQPRQTYGKHWAWWGVGIAAAALALSVMPRRAEHRPVIARRITPPVVLPKSNIESEKTTKFVPAAMPHMRRSRPLRAAGIRAITLIAQADREPTLKMTTTDPNVVIFWQLNDKTER